jgi:hypothetical protein
MPLPVELDPAFDYFGDIGAPSPLPDHPGTGLQPHFAFDLDCTCGGELTCHPLQCACCHAGGRHSLLPERATRSSKQQIAWKLKGQLQARMVAAPGSSKVLERHRNQALYQRFQWLREV